jgi:hypothetical protein
VIFTGDGRGGPAYDFGNSKIVTRRCFMANSLGATNSIQNVGTGVDYEILGYGSPTSWWQDVTQEDDYVDGDFETESHHGVQHFRGCVVGPGFEIRARNTTIAPTTITFEGSTAHPRGIIRYHRHGGTGSGQYPQCVIGGYAGSSAGDMTVTFTDQDFVTWGTFYLYHSQRVTPVSGQEWAIRMGEVIDAANDDFIVILNNCTARVGATMPAGSNTVRLLTTSKALSTKQIVRIDGLTIGAGFARDAIVLNGQRLEYHDVTHEGYPGATIQQICPGAGQYVAF